MAQLPNLSRFKPALSRRSVGIVLSVLLLGGGLYQAVSTVTTERGELAADAAMANRQEASKLAIKLSGLFRPQTEAMQSIAQDPQVVAALGKADRAALRRLGDELQARVPGALRLRLVLPNTVEPDTSNAPPLVYAGLNMLRKAGLGEAPVPIEFHLPATVDAHIALVGRVPPVGLPVGFVHLALDPKLVKDHLASLNLQGYAVDLRQPLPGQTSALIGSSPGANPRWAEVARAPVPGTAWQLVLRGEGSSGVDNLVSLPALSGLVLVVLMMAVLLRRRRRVPVGDASGPHYQGAILAIYNGEYPGLEGLVRGTTAIPDAPPRADEADLSPTVQTVDLSLFDAVSDADFVDLVPDEPATTAPSSGAEPARPPVAPVVFRAYDIRGIAEETLTTDAVYQIARAIGAEAIAHGHQTVVIARDGRRSSPALHQALLSGLRESGRDVLDIGMVPTPLLYFATNYLDIPTGVMLTGSHNPAQYNGLKVVINGTTLSGEAIQAIRRRVNEQDFSTGNGSVQVMDIVSDYIRQVSEDIPVALSRPMKVVVDCANAVPGLVVPQLLRALGHDVVELNCELDGDFPNHPPDPSQPSNLEDLMLAVKLQSADLGLAFDGDGDRLGVVDSTGKVIWPDRQLMLFARDLLSRNPGARVVFDVKCSSKLAREIRAGGGEPVIWKSGHSLIKSKMQETGALLGGEMTGHLFFREGWFGFDDGIYASARLLEILVNEKRSPAAVFASLPDTIATPEILLPMDESHHQRFMESLLAAASFDGAERTLIDGLRVDYPDRWGLVRPSNTSASIVLRFEGDTAAALHHIQQEFRELLHKIDPSLKIPF